MLADKMTARRSWFEATVVAFRFRGVRRCCGGVRGTWRGVS
jgi:hypothetical protein